MRGRKRRTPSSLQGQSPGEILATLRRQSKWAWLMIPIVPIVWTIVLFITAMLMSVGVAELWIDGRMRALVAIPCLVGTVLLWLSTSVIGFYTWFELLSVFDYVERFTQWSLPKPDSVGQLGPQGENAAIPAQGALRFRFETENGRSLRWLLALRSPRPWNLVEVEGRFQVELDGCLLFDETGFWVVEFLQVVNDWKEAGATSDLWYGSGEMMDDDNPILHFRAAPDGWHFASTWQLAEAQRPIGAAELRAALDALRQDLRAMSRLRPAKSNTEEGR